MLESNRCIHPVRHRLTGLFGERPQVFPLRTREKPTQIRHRVLPRFRPGETRPRSAHGLPRARPPNPAPQPHKYHRPPPRINTSTARIIANTRRSLPNNRDCSTGPGVGYPHAIGPHRGCHSPDRDRPRRVIHHSLSTTPGPPFSPSTVDPPVSPCSPLRTSS